MKNFDLKDLTIFFEGEIYNKNSFLFYDEILLLEDLYLKFGFEFLSKLDGVFAFCIYDKRKNLYFCSRDRFGNIPFYYTIKENKFIFSTSIKDILKELPVLPKINKVAISKYMQYFSTFGEDTFYTDIYKLEEASFIVFEKNKDLIKKRYYKINTYKAINDENRALKDLEELLYSAIEKRLISSPSTLLSGGVDSSTISSIYTKISGKKIDTFSIGYSEYKNYCELDFAKITSKHIGSNHHEVIIDKKTYIDNFYSSLDNFDEPHADSAAIPLNILLKNVKNCGVNKLLSGEGADELFLGYDNYAKFLKYYKFQESLTKEQNDFLEEIVSALQNNTKESEYLRRVVKKQNIYNSFGEVFNDMQKRKLFTKVPTFKSETPKKDFVDNMSYIDIKLWVANPVLTKVYGVSTANSLQIHTPFLDNDILKYIFSVESSIKVGDTNKYLLKKIAQKHIPKEIINRVKKGFNSPFNEWLQSEFGSSILDTILEVNRQTQFFNENYLKHIYSLASSNKFKQHLYSLFIFSLWYKKVYM
ncbi:asparagine synthase (glutamine-hydrolyzing) [Aliarcobacter faecis]|uniref:asparagine synthetase B family protein n=1 Tax=Aliarcobacter faecis TaxID=1564138 RepID=UPI0004B15BEE|nr:asparagine synthase-related protein [Aliarcobacter faecis]QKF74358.1 asparagine synthase (glutamine-hydrolyzing) [Aliarcobacter faecis]